MWQRIETQPEDKTADPPKNLRVSMRLDPGGRKRSQTVLAADGNQVPNAQKSSGQEHEQQAGTDVNAQQKREMFFLLCQQEVRNFLPGLLPGVNCYQTSCHSLPLEIFFQLERTREQDVVFQVDVIVHVAFECFQPIVKSTITW